MTTISISRDACRIGYEGLSLKEKEEVFKCFEYLTSKKVKSDWFLSIACNYWWQSKISIEDAYAYYKLLGMMAEGNLYFSIGIIDNCGYPDKMDEQNKNNILTYSNHAVNKFNLHKVVVVSDTQDHDGSLWASNLTMSQLLPEKNLIDKNTKIVTESKQEYHFSVEIGYYDLCRFFVTLLMESGLIRIPYETPVIKELLLANKQEQAKGLMGFFRYKRPRYLIDAIDSIDPSIEKNKAQIESDVISCTRNKSYIQLDLGF